MDRVSIYNTYLNNDSAEREVVRFRYNYFNCIKVTYKEIETSIAYIANIESHRIEKFLQDNATIDGNKIKVKFNIPGRIRGLLVVSIKSIISGVLEYIVDKYKNIDIIEIDTSSSDFSNILDASNMFCLDRELNSVTPKLFVKLPGGNRKIKPVVTHFMFHRSNLINFDDVIEHIDTSYITDATYMFASTGIKRVNIRSAFKRLTNAVYMFNSCTNLEEFVCELDTFRLVNNTYCMFVGCENLKYANIQGFNGGSIINMAEMFYKCYNLTKVVLPDKMISAESINVDASKAFFKCMNLKDIDISKLLLCGCSGLLCNGMFAETKNIPWYSEDKNVHIRSKYTYKLFFRGMFSKCGARVMNLSGIYIECRGQIMPFLALLSLDAITGSGVTYDDLPDILIIDSEQYKIELDKYIEIKDSNKDFYIIEAKHEDIGDIIARSQLFGGKTVIVDKDKGVTYE